MSSLSKCLKQMGLSQHEAAILRGKSKQLMDDDGLAAHEAAVQAVQEHIDELLAERTDVVTQITAAGGIAPDLGKAQNTGKESSDVGRTGQRQLSLLDAPARGARGDGGRGGEARQSPRVADRGPMGGGRPGQSQADGSQRDLDTQAEGTGTTGSGNDQRRAGERPQQRRAGQRDPAGERNQPTAVGPSNYTITADDELGSGGAKTKARQNLAAIRLLKTLAQDNRQATPEEQAVLVKYVGWGGIKNVFDEANADWAKERAELKELVEVKEYEAARRSVLDAHFTSATVVDGIYYALNHLGFKGGRVLEPALGTGHFFGLMPPAVMNASQLFGIELDPITGAIAKHLYQRADIKAPRGFQDVRIPEGHFDLAIGNPPFGNQTLNDADNPEFNKLSIHNFFFAKSIKSLRPGGVLAMVVSHYFLDAQKSGNRAYIAKHAEFIGAIRLPNTAFLKNANTEVTTDIVFFKKREQPIKADAVKAETWLGAGEMKDAATGEPIRVGNYFLENPHMMLGRMTLGGTMYGKGEATLEPNEGEDLGDAIYRAVQYLPQGVYQQSSVKLDELTATDGLVPEHSKVGGLFVMPNGKLAIRTPDVLDKPQHKEYEAANERAIERIKGLVKVRDKVRDLMRAELNDDTDQRLNRLRRELNTTYDGFVKKQGFINAQANRRAFHDDPDLPLLESLERDYDPGLSKDVAKNNQRKIADALKVAETNGEAVDPAVQALVTTAREPSAKKAAIFERSVLVPYKEVSSAASAADALSASLNDRGRVDLEFMAQIYGRPADQIKGELAGVLYEDPKEGWVTADAYLSGNVKEKLTQARIAAGKNPQFKSNVDALERVQPPDIPAVDISVRFGSSWVPAKDLGDFIHSLLGVRPASLTYQKSVARWFLNLPYSDNTLFNQTWGARTDEAVSWPANKIIGALLSNAPIIVKKNIGTSAEPQYVTLDQETDLARAKAEAIEGKFKEWVFADQARRERLERLYNDTYNTDQLRTYDGSHLTLPGTNPAIALTPNKRHSVWRIIQSPNTLLDHVVGSGKTFTIASAFMEMRRLGIVKKPMVVVPNHIVRPWRDEWYALYPNANILATTEEDFKKENRKRLFAKIATGDWDAVIVAHSSFERIAMPPDEERSILNEQVSDIAEAIKQIKDDHDQRLTVRQLENMKAKLEAKLQAAMDRTATKDEFIHFGEMGVDALAIDELHEFKNLYYYSQLRNVTGMGSPEGSGKAFDLFVKLRYLQKRNGRVIGATGTPISNSLVEMFTMQRFLDYDGLKAQGVAHLDAWAGVFADIMQVWETHPSGNGYRLSTRFARFVNLAELVTQYRKFADVITQGDMIAMAKKAGGKYPIPKVMGGKPKMHIAERSDLQSYFFGVPEFVRNEDGNIAFEHKLDEKGKDLGPDPDKPLLTYNESSILWKYEHLRDLIKESDGKINALSITNEARKAGLDYRLIDPNAADDAGAKSNLAAAEIERLYRKWDAKRGTQLVFIDLSTPKGTKAPKAKAAPEGEEDAVDMDEMLGATAPFSVYDDLRTKLIERGIPAAEIAFIHDAHTADQKNKLFGRVNRGEVRVLFGSTKKMGAGTNVQKRVVGKHDLDAPWRPSDLEQRDGRVVRQGNELYAEDPEGFEVELHRYATAKTYDTRMWQIIEHKASGIEQLRKGVLGARVMEDVSGEAANAAEMKAAASGNPLIAEEIKLRDRLKRLGNQFDGWRRGRYALEASIANLEQAPSRAAAERDRVNKLIDAREDKPEKGIVFTAGDGAVITESKNIVGPVSAAFKDTAASLKPVRIGGYRGFSVFAHILHGAIDIRMGVGTYRDGEFVTSYSINADEFSPSGFIARLDNYLERFDGDLRTIEAQETRAAAELVNARAELTVPFEHAKELEETREKHREIASSLQRAGGGVEMTDEMKRELEEARAKLQPSDKTALSRMGEVGAGMALPDVQAVADIYQRHFKGLKINVLASLKAAPAALRSDIRALDGESDTMGAWHNGEIYLFADRLDGPEHAAWVIAHEATHHGLRGMFKGALDPAMMEVYFTNRTMRAEANKLQGVNPKLSKVRAVEEALANMGGNGVPQNVMQRLVAAVKRLLRQAGVSLEVTDADVRDLVVRALRFVRRPAKATHFMSGSAMLSRQATGSGRAPVPQRSGLLDKAFRLPTQALQIDRLTGWAYDTLLEKLSAFVPEKVKAGVVADFGLPEQVTDRRADMQAHMRKALRQTQGFLQRMSELTRAESRIAYEWMTGQAEESTLEQLPEESREVMTQLRRLVSSLGTEAVRLGQLGADVHERNKLSYLHRSYLKHEVEQGPQVKAKRARAVKILGDQYKGRGMAHEVAMAKIRNIAPDWWKRKLQAGKGDPALKGEGFLRLERRANRGEGVAVLPGMDATGQLGKLLEVAYWPAGEAVPARLQSWHQDAGTWEVRDVKGPNAILWRDFTKDERGRMGEIDEVRYAVAKTLHQMVHDIEVGRYFEWLSAHEARPKPDGLTVVKAGESLFRTFAPDEWVLVPDTNIEGTQVKRYGKLAGLYVPGPVWNDVRQVGNAVFQPLGETYATVLKAWKISKTALSPAVHLNNIMANVIMADWHDVMARDVLRALNAMVHDNEESRGLVEAFEDAGGAQGMYVLSEIQRDQLRPLLEALERDVEAAGGAGMVNAVSVVQALLHGRIREAATAAADSKVAKAGKFAANKMIDLYQAEDTVFRLAAFLKAKSEGKSDREAGKFARSSFLDYHINAPWIQMMRQTAFPFVSFVYRAVPMLLETMARKPWKLMKLAAVLGGLNAIGYLFSGGDEDKERKLLPEEKRGKIFGFIAPKLIRLPWNDLHGSPMFMDIRRFIPVGDILDTGQTHGALPILPALMPGGPLAIVGELALNKSAFTGKPITKETDTGVEMATKVFEHLYKAAVPNLPFLPGTYSYTGIKNAGTGRTDAFGRDQNLPAALASSVGIKIASYPRDMAQLGVKLDRDAKVREINENIGGLKRELQRRGITQNEFDEKVKVQIDKWRKIELEAGERLR